MDSQEQPWDLRRPPIWGEPTKWALLSADIHNGMSSPGLQSLFLDASSLWCEISRGLPSCTDYMLSSPWISMSAFLWSDDPVSVTTPPGKQPLPEVTEEGVGGWVFTDPLVGVQDQHGWGSSSPLLAVSPTSLWPPCTLRPCSAGLSCTVTLHRQSLTDRALCRVSLLCVTGNRAPASGDEGTAVHGRGYLPKPCPVWGGQRTLHWAHGARDSGPSLGQCCPPSWAAACLWSREPIWVTMPRLLPALTTPGPGGGCGPCAFVF